MKIIVRLVLLAAVVALGFWLWLFLFPSPQKIIRDRLNKVVQLASFSANEGNISRVAHIQALGTYFTDEIELKLDVPGVETHTFNRREELTQAALAAKQAVTSVNAEFVDIDIDLEPDNISAIAKATLRADIGSEKNAIAQQLKIHLIKTNGTWLIHGIDTVRTLR